MIFRVTREISISSRGAQRLSSVSKEGVGEEVGDGGGAGGAVPGQDQGRRRAGGRVHDPVHGRLLLAGVPPVLLREARLPVARVTAK